MGNQWERRRERETDSFTGILIRTEILDRETSGTRLVRRRKPVAMRRLSRWEITGLWMPQIAGISKWLTTRRYARPEWEKSRSR